MEEAKLGAGSQPGTPERSRSMPYVRSFEIECEREGSATRHKKNFSIIVYSVSEAKPVVSVLLEEIWIPRTSNFPTVGGA